MVKKRECSPEIDVRVLFWMAVPVICILLVHGTTTGCTTKFSSGKDKNICGDGVMTGDEECDGDDFGGKTCADWTGKEYGRLLCSDDCRVDTSMCRAAPECTPGETSECDNCGIRECDDAGFWGDCICEDAVINLSKNPADVASISRPTGWSGDPDCDTTCTKAVWTKELGAGESVLLTATRDVSWFITGMDTSCSVGNICAFSLNPEETVDVEVVAVSRIEFNKAGANVGTFPPPAGFDGPTCGTACSQTTWIGGITVPTTLALEVTDRPEVYWEVSGASHSCGLGNTCELTMDPGSTAHVLVTTPNCSIVSRKYCSTLGENVYLTPLDSTVEGLYYPRETTAYIYDRIIHAEDINATWAGFNDPTWADAYDEDGSVNTDWLLGNGTFPGARACREQLGPEWYLPSMVELNWFFSHRSAFDLAPYGSTARYNSSNQDESTSFFVRQIRAEDGMTSAWYKSHMNRHRCIRQFPDVGFRASKNQL